MSQTLRFLPSPVHVTKPRRQKITGVLIVSNDTSMGCKWYIRRGETLRNGPYSASEDQIGTRQRACIIDASVYTMRPSVRLQGFWRERKLVSFIFSLYILLTSLFFSPLPSFASRSHNARPTPFWIYITEFSNLSRSGDWTNNVLRKGPSTSLVRTFFFLGGGIIMSPPF